MASHYTEEMVFRPLPLSTQPQERVSDTSRSLCDEATVPVCPSICRTSAGTPAGLPLSQNYPQKQVSTVVGKQRSIHHV